MMNTVVILSALATTVLSKDLYFGSGKPRISTDTAQDQFMDCYDYLNQGGDRLRVIDYIPALALYNFDNRISSCCLTGIWLFYADNDYNIANPSAADWWVYGDNYCTNVPTKFDNAISSLRHTGAPDAWTADTINFYFNEFFIGGEEYYYRDTAQLNYDNQAKSIIVTGCSGWTLYSEKNYAGTCKCVWPSDVLKCYPGFYTTESSLGILSKTVSSAKKGCFCAASALPDNQGMKVENGGASGFFTGKN